MLGRSLNKLEHQDFGFQVANRVEVDILGPSSEKPLPAQIAFARQLEENMRRIPGVDSADVAMYNPLTDNWGELIMVAGHPPAKINEESGASWDRVGRRLLATSRRSRASRPLFHRSRQRNHRSGRRREPSIRQTLFQRQTKILSTSTSVLISRNSPARSASLASSPTQSSRVSLSASLRDPCSMSRRRNT